MKLRDFLQAQIPLSEHIVLIQNRRFSRKYTAWNQYFRNPKICFAGYEDNSVNSIDLLQERIQGIARRNPRKSLIILLGKGDYLLDDDFADKLPENVMRVYGCNCVANDERLRFFPMGRDFRNAALHSSTINKTEKDLLCYCNFSIDTFPGRKHVYQTIQNKDFIEFDHMGEFLNYSLSREEFLQKLARSKYCICPRGNAIDTFRFWDCLYSGTIPIVLREDFHDHVTDLPVLFVENLEQLAGLTEDALHKHYSDFLNQEYNFEKLYLSYWFEKIREDARPRGRNLSRFLRSNQSEYAPD